MREPLDSDVISAALITSGQPWRSVDFRPAMESTNRRATETVRSYADTRGATPRVIPPGYAAGSLSDATPLWRIVLTDDQTRGRGRLGRSWQVPPRASLAVSAIVPAPAPASLGWVPLVAGLALARAIVEVTEGAGTRVEPRLKWPNDVLVPVDADRKVAGILCEFASWGDGRQAVVVGTGVNVDQERDELPVDTATSLRLCGATVHREDLVVAYLKELAAVLSGNPTDGGRALREDYRRWCSTIGSRVRAHLPGGTLVEGTAVRVDDGGSLVIEAAGGPHHLSAGDVVHVRPASGPAGMIGP